MSEVWTYKYNPITLSEVIGHSRIMKRFQGYVANPLTTPHMILDGPPGTGKTASARALAHDILGENFKIGWKELNASDSRTIKDFREIIKPYIKNVPFIKIPFKFLLLDEGEQLTPGVQKALRSEMEKYAHRTKVIICCNNKSKISPPMQSRCRIENFGPLSITAVKKVLGGILQKEGVGIEDEAYLTLMEIYKGDMRKIISAAQGAVEDGIITKDIIVESAGYADDATVRKLIDVTLTGDFNGACSYVGSLLWNQRIEPAKLISRMGQYVSKNEDIHIKHRLKIASIVADVNAPIFFGADAQTQITGLIAKIIDEIFPSGQADISQIGHKLKDIRSDQLQEIATVTGVPTIQKDEEEEIDLFG